MGFIKTIEEDTEHPGIGSNQIRGNLSLHKPFQNKERHKSSMKTHSIGRLWILHSAIQVNLINPRRRSSTSPKDTYPGLAPTWNSNTFQGIPDTSFDLLERSVVIMF
jgi:hypothetical protein